VLASLRLEFEVLHPDVDETRLPDEPAMAYVERVARSKAQAVDAGDDVVVAADTAVVLEGRVLGKPAHPEEARSMLRRLQGTRHEVLTGLAVRLGDSTHSLVESTDVEMGVMTEDEIAAYVDSGEPMDKAGAHALQGEGGVFVVGVNGSPSNVIGLPVHLLPRLFGRLGIDLSGFRSR
jgi:septum formation protein